VIEFYRLGYPFISGLVILSSLCTAIQATAVIAGFNRHKAAAADRIENLLQAFVLAHTFLLALLISRLRTDYYASLIIPSEYIMLRYSIFGIIAVLAITVGVLCHKPQVLTIIPIAALTIPFTEEISNHVFPWLYTLALLLIMVCAGVFLIRQRMLYGREITAFSIKEGVDALHSGLFCCRMNGEIILINRKMQDLMRVLTGRLWRNGLEFRRALLEGDTIIKPQSTVLDGEIVYLLDDGTAWLFSEAALQISGKEHIQLSAADVTDRWELTDELRIKQEELRYRGEELSAALTSLDELRRGEELLRLKSKVHDMMAQRLALLMRIFRSEMSIDEEDLISFADDMLAEVRREGELEDETDNIETLCKIYGDIGVKITIEGNPPEGESPERNQPEEKPPKGNQTGGNPLKGSDYAAFYSVFVREAVTNAVSHGLATEVMIICSSSKNENIISVSNNGVLPALTIIEGSGITELRRRAAILGGTIDIATKPNFEITAHFNKANYANTDIRGTHKG